MDLIREYGGFDGNECWWIGLGNMEKLGGFDEGIWIIRVDIVDMIGDMEIKCGML